MDSRFGFAYGRQRRVPTFDDYETIDLGEWSRLSPEEQARVQAYLEGPIGRLLAALRDAEDAAGEMRGERATQCLVGIHGARLFAERALEEVGHR